MVKYIVWTKNKNIFNKHFSILKMYKKNLNQVEKLITSSLNKNLYSDFSKLTVDILELNG